MISGKPVRRRRALFWSTIASAALHILILTLLFYAIARTIVPKGEREVVSQTTVVTIKKAAEPPPAPHRAVRPVRQHQSAPAAVPRPELARVTTRPAPPLVTKRSISVPSKIERDEAGFAREVAQLNEQNDPHAIPTIDPAARESSTKSYAFDIPSSMRGERTRERHHYAGAELAQGRTRLLLRTLRVHVSRRRDRERQHLLAVLFRSGRRSVQAAAASDSVPAADARV